MAWNCRGISHPDTESVLWGIVKKCKQECVFLIVTKCGHRAMKRICKRMGFIEYVIIDPKLKAGGFALMWNGNLKMELLWNTNRIICCKVDDVLGNNIWNLMTCYGTPYLAEKQIF